jgi:pilus assembly protein CpaB
MQRRVIAAIAAVLLAGIGAVLLYSYVNSADKRAMAGQEATTVLVVSKVVPNGTPAENIAPYVEVRQLPRAAVVPGALTNTSEVAGLATTTELQVGEQLIRARFADPTTITTGKVVIPKDKQEVSVQLEPQRVVGSTIVAGDKIGIYFTIGEETRLVLSDVLVTNAQGGLDPASKDENAAPSGSLVITLALDAADVERVVFAAEAGRIWVARESAEPGKQITTGTTAKNVFK